MKHTIEIEGLPEGWEVTSIKLPDNCTKQIDEKTISVHNVPGATFVLKKKQPRRIVLEETDEDIEKNMDQLLLDRDDILIRLIRANKYWRVVENSE